MNAPAPIKILTACAEKYALCCVSGEMEMQWAVDMLQNFAEQRGLVAELGQDKIQDVIAAAFIWARSLAAADEAEVEDLPSDYASQLVMQWELDDKRDRWKWTGELPPAPEVMPIEKPAYHTPQSTVDAFLFALSAGDPDRLAVWLRNHVDDAPAFARMLEAA
ncbi:hypothetical protein [Bradyrhizobium sp. WSM2793]|uniref:hypothetical protein n=1 Tax=Bradyrhizobium sp. WSM2793 TaxID=1038866 RepID=UPI0012FC8E21|nr:hypothetical protein [Bradyrhizobium sp. WSM2793]